MPLPGDEAFKSTVYGVIPIENTTHLWVLPAPQDALGACLASQESSWLDPRPLCFIKSLSGYTQDHLEG